LPGASSASTRPYMHPKVRPATATAPSVICCATPTSSRIMSARCSRFISGNALFWWRRAMSRSWPRRSPIAAPTRWPASRSWPPTPSRERFRW